VPIDYLANQPAQDEYFCENSAQARSRRLAGSKERVGGTGQKCSGVATHGRDLPLQALGSLRTVAVLLNLKIGGSRVSDDE